MPSTCAAAVKIPAIEVHVSNVGAGDNFRHHSFTAQAAFASLCGFGIDGFRLAISGLAAKIGAQARKLSDNDVIQLAGVKMGFFEG